MLVRFYRPKLDNRGDTIVEVMIVLAVLGLAIGIAYATANRSLLNARQAQENSQATALVQSQVEALRTLSTDTTQNIFQAGPYCLTESPPYAVTSSCDFGTIPYNIAITYASATSTFTVKATWQDVISSDEQDTVTTSYRLHKP